MPWSKETFEKLVAAASPKRSSRASKSTHGMLLNVLEPAERGRLPRACSGLIRDCHETPATRRRLAQARRSSFSARSSSARSSSHPAEHPLARERRPARGFLAQPRAVALSLDTIELLDPHDPDYALDLLTLVESILENPELILRKQLDRIKGDKMAELKEQGMEYDERMAELEKLEYPKPNREFIYETFNAFAAAHPWVGQENIRPKSIAREMYEDFQSFPEYIRDYELQRSKGLLLRYCRSV